MGIAEPRLVVVFGGCGFIGSRVCSSLLKAGYRVRVFRRTTTSTKLITKHLNDVEIITADYSKCDEVIAALKDADFLIHLIHNSVPGSSMKDPAFELQSNVVSMASWLSRIGETALHRIVYVSSGGTVYGAPRALPVTEEHPLHPMSVYGIAKVACENLIAMYSQLAGIEYRIARPANAYGEGQGTDRNQGILGVLAAQIGKMNAIEVWGSGNGLRDYVHVDDISEALLALLTHEGPNRIFNVSTGAGHSVLDLIEAFRSRVPHFPKVIHFPPRGFDVPDNVLSNCRLRNETEWAPKINLESGINQLLSQNYEADRLQQVEARETSLSPAASV